jgi:hypothetical protein
MNVKKIAFVLVFGFLGGILFAGGKMDASMVSNADIAKIEGIVKALDPEVAIQAALDNFPKSTWPLNDYLEIQKMKINRVFNEYGTEFNQYNDYEGLSPKASVAFAKLKSRYSYLSSMELKKSDELRAALVLLKD